MKINYLKGDATKPLMIEGDDLKIICHCVNDEGRWGSGFVLALNDRWPHAESSYRTWANGGMNTKLVLGETLFVPVEIGVKINDGGVVWTNTWVANVVGQHRTIRDVKVPIRYEAIERGLDKVVNFCEGYKASVHMPRMGAGLARGKWEVISEIIDRTLIKANINTYVYDLP